MVARGGQGVDVILLKWVGGVGAVVGDVEHAVGFGVLAVIAL